MFAAWSCIQSVENLKHDIVCACVCVWETLKSGVSPVETLTSSCESASIQNYRRAFHNLFISAE